MKKVIALLFSLSAVLILTGVSFSAAKSSVDLGRELFHDPAFAGSKNAKTCGSCHNKGEKLNTAQTRISISKLINKCITGPMEGEKLDGRTAQMKSLKLYIKSLAKSQ